MADYIPTATAVVVDNDTSYNRSSTVTGDHAVKPMFEHPGELNPKQVSALHQQGFPLGLAEELGNSCRTFPIRFWIVDNSGSMRAPDGNRIVSASISDKEKFKVESCNRWIELQGSVSYHIELAGLLRVSTVFRMLNDPGVKIGPQEFSVAEQDAGKIEHDVKAAKQIIERSEPRGVTPLTQHLLAIRSRIQSMEQKLNSQGQQAVIVIATDGLPSNAHGKSTREVQQEFVDTLQSLQSLPVWLVVRLCTDDDDVVEYYNNLDNQLELPLEVIDDFFGEAEEIRGANKWLNYALPLHRCREMGYHHRIFDLLDERLLTKDEMLEYMKLLFGAVELADAPDIHADWKGFTSYLGNVVTAHARQWNPISLKMDPWIDMKQLEKAYGDGFTLFKRLSIAKKKGKR